MAIVNERFVRKFDLDDGAVANASPSATRANLDIEIVGVVADATYSMVKDDIPAQYFVPRRQNDNLGTLSFYVRAAVEPDALLPTIPRVIGAIDPDLPVSGMTTMRRVVQGNVFLDRLVALLSAGFAGLATPLAAIGLYGVLAISPQHTGCDALLMNVQPATTSIKNFHTSSFGVARRRTLAKEQSAGVRDRVEFGQAHRGRPGWR